MRWVIFIILVVALIVWGGLLEDGAESQAIEFCDSAAVGDSYLETVAKANAVGEDQLRIISKESITVGFTGK